MNEDDPRTVYLQAFLDAETPAEENEAMVRAWLDSQELPGLKPFLLDAVRGRLLPEFAEIAEAFASESADEAHRLTHRMKGWTGTYRMDEVCEFARRLERAARGGRAGMAAAHDDLVALGRLLARIPLSYLAD